ncbi:MAG: hypothetical protein GF383_02950, partial [Candidatus Lokiarchaeota archaeon]|nr:hypothetical protein [Candidatus Lokiarchaeota archaeon]
IPIYKLDEWGVFLFLGVMVLQGLILPIPSELILVGAGMIWGWMLGGLYGVIGLLFAALLCYYVGKEGGRPVVTRLLGVDILRLGDRILTKHGAKTMLTARIIPLFPFDPVSYIAGIGKWNFKKYILITLVGAIIRAYFFSLLGAAVGFPPDSITLETVSAAALEQQAAWFNILFVIVSTLLLLIFIIYYKLRWSK